MTALTLEYPPGATPLDANELAGLIPSYITTQGELNILEQSNILEARSWALGKTHAGLLGDAFVRRLHQKMFKDVWKWAGAYRLSDKSIGVPWQNISVDVHKLVDDTRYWIENRTYPWDELGARFHHRLVAVHAFPNGNGRHARLMTDALLRANQQQPFSWGNTSLDGSGDVRTEYVSALREADDKKIARLVRFVRS